MCVLVSFFSSSVFYAFNSTKYSELLVKPLGHSRRSSCKFADVHIAVTQFIVFFFFFFWGGYFQILMFKLLCFCFWADICGKKREKDYVNWNSARMHAVVHTNMHQRLRSATAVITATINLQKIDRLQNMQPAVRAPERVFKDFIETLSIMTLLKQNHRPKWPVYASTTVLWCCILTLHRFVCLLHVVMCPIINKTSAVRESAAVAVISVLPFPPLSGQPR